MKSHEEYSIAATVGVIIVLIAAALLWAFVKINEGKPVSEVTGISLFTTNETEDQNG